MSNIVEMNLFDFSYAKDKSNLGQYVQQRMSTGIKGTCIKLFDPVTHELLLPPLHNKVVIAGSQTTACKHWGLKKAVEFPSYNNALDLDGTVNIQTPENEPYIVLFGCGIDGCGTENSQVYPVKTAGWVKPDALIPFRYQLDNNDLSDELRAIYFGRKSVGNRIAYYFKAFDDEPRLYIRYVDGTVIDANVYTSVNNKEVEVFVESKQKITKEDFRDYFIATTGQETARINNITLLTAWYTIDGTYKYYQDIQPMTQLNIPNESLIDLTKGIDVTYHVYY